MRARVAVDPARQRRKAGDATSNPTRRDPRHDPDRDPRGAGADRHRARHRRRQLHQALDLYKLELGRYPTTQEGLQALVSAPTGTANWNGPYWKKPTLPKDPWNNEYRYVSPAQGAPFEIVSLGADGKEGGEGVEKDISSLR